MTDYTHSSLVGLRHFPSTFSVFENSVICQYWFYWPTHQCVLQCLCWPRLPRSSEFTRLLREVWFKHGDAETGDRKPDKEGTKKVEERGNWQRRGRKGWRLRIFPPQKQFFFLRHFLKSNNSFFISKLLGQEIFFFFFTNEIPELCFKTVLPGLSGAFCVFQCTNGRQLHLWLRRKSGATLKAIMSQRSVP